jgi:ribokinase
MSAEARVTGPILNNRINAPTAFDVVVCGSLHLDIVVRAAALPRLDETVVGTSWHKICGGKGGNQAIQAAKAGARTAMVGRVGKDEFGQTLIENLMANAVNIAAVSVDETRGSGMSVAILQDNGDYGAVIVSGANLAIDAQALEQAWDQFSGAKVLVLQNEIPDAVNVAAAKIAKNAGAHIILNAAPARPIDAAFFELLDVLIVNRVEAETMSGKVVHDAASAMAALPELAGGGRSIIITLGGDGLIVMPEKEAPVFIAALPVKVTSTHGAGDCFVGVLAAKLAAGDRLIDACHAANRAAAKHVSRTEPA